MAEEDSPVSNGGRGLKQAAVSSAEGLRSDSPVSNGGRGLKPYRAALPEFVTRDSPVSNGGRGLKRVFLAVATPQPEIRPSAMAGVD